MQRRFFFFSSFIFSIFKQRSTQSRTRLMSVAQRMVLHDPHCGSADNPVFRVTPCALYPIRPYTALCTNKSFDARNLLGTRANSVSANFYLHFFFQMRSQKEYNRIGSEKKVCLQFKQRIVNRRIIKPN